MLELICLACWTGLAGGSFILLIADHSSSRAHAHSGANLVNVRASKVTKLVKFVSPGFSRFRVNFEHVALFSRLDYMPRRHPGLDPGSAFSFRCVSNKKADPGTRPG